MVYRRFCQRRNRQGWRYEARPERHRRRYQSLVVGRHPSVSPLVSDLDLLLPEHCSNPRIWQDSIFTSHLASLCVWFLHVAWKLPHRSKHRSPGYSNCIAAYSGDRRQRYGCLFAPHGCQIHRYCFDVRRFLLRFQCSRSLGRKYHSAD